MSSVADLLQLQQPVTDGGIRAVNFFNGRLLSGKDLSREQAARREADARIGLALGHGVASGLNVVFDAAASAPDQPVVAVSRGLALNRSGLPLRLARDTRLALARHVEATAVDSVFTGCRPLTGGTYVAGAGLYVLTIAPAAWPEGRAATSGLDPAHVRCNTDATVEGVQFRLLPIERQRYADLDVDAATFRNEIAYRCFGPGVQADWFANLLDAPPRDQNLLTGLKGLSDDDVPLALLFFTDVADLKFIDMWAVRRDVARADGDGAFESVASDRRRSLGKAMWLQFQAQFDSLFAAGRSQDPVVAQESFRFLPPAGIVAIKDDGAKALGQMPAFFSGLTCRGPTYLNAARLERLLQDSHDYPPVDIRSRELLCLYRVRESELAILNGPASTAPRHYTVFASGHLPFVSAPQFDLGHWNYSNFTR